MRIGWIGLTLLLVPSWQSAIGQCKSLTFCLPSNRKAGNTNKQNWIITRVETRRGSSSEMLSKCAGGKAFVTLLFRLAMERGGHKYLSVCWEALGAVFCRSIDPHCRVQNPRLLIWSLLIEILIFDLLYSIKWSLLPSLNCPSPAGGEPTPVLSVAAKSADLSGCWK